MILASLALLYGSTLVHAAVPIPSADGKPGVPPPQDGNKIADPTFHGGPDQNAISKPKGKKTKGGI